MNQENFFTYLIVAITITTVILLILRELVCWYYKINDIVSLLEDIKTSLNSQKQLINNTSPIVSTVNKEEMQGKEICPFCKEPSLKTNKICEICGSKKR
jgi:hypothetical protein